MDIDSTDIYVLLMNGYYLIYNKLYSIFYY